MAKLVYSVIASLDGYIADRNGNFDFAFPDEDVHRFVNDLEREIGTYLYGRRMYETMAVWQTMDVSGEPPFVSDFAEIWRAADKVVYSSSLQSVTTPKTRLERTFDPNTVKRLKEHSERDISVGGAGLAGHAIAAGLVNEYQVFLAPAIVGGGTRFLPDDVRVDLTLVEQRRFRNGCMFLRYRNG